MSKRLIPIYQYLIGTRKHHLQGWYDDYQMMTSEVQAIKGKLSERKTLQDPETYEGTRYKGVDNPYQAFIQQLLYEKANGISSRGQSVLSWNNLLEFLKIPEFEDVITELIRNPSLESYDGLQQFWRDQKIGNNPVLINRAVAACDTGLTSTVDGGKFYQVFHWLQNEGLLPVYPQDEPQNWYSHSRFVMEHLKQELAGEKAEPIWLSIFYWEMYSHLAHPFSLKKQVVKYGAPGTGKTYQAKQVSKLQFLFWESQFEVVPQEVRSENHIEFVQFHPSYSYEDFIEGLRPVLKEGQAQLQLQNGIFKEFCIRAGQWECDLAPLEVDKGWEELSVGDIQQYEEKLSTKDRWNSILTYPNKDKKIHQLIPPYFFLIDEINRAELSRVFGELMYCLEYRGTEGAIKTQYASLNTDDTGMIKIGEGYQFFIPHNLYLIATMNTIDRSVESFDFALRRRFRWEDVEPDTWLLRYHLQTHNSKWEILADNLHALNEAIQSEPLLGKDYRIGHAYFWNLPYPKHISVSEVRRHIWEDSIASLLHEYLRGSGRDELLEEFAKKFGV